MTFVVNRALARVVLAWLGLLFAHPAWCGEGAQSAECALADGSKFILTGFYRSGVTLFGHATLVRAQREGWSISYQASGPHAAKTELPVGLPMQGADQIDCSTLGKIGNTLKVGAFFLRKEGVWIDSRGSDIPSKLKLPATLAAQSPDIRSDLERRGLVVGEGYAVLAPQDGALLYELPLLQCLAQYKHCVVAAVYTSVSSDDGKTWADPEVREQSVFFARGRSLSDQCFVARPILLNGKKWDASFPPCPVGSAGVAGEAR